MKLKRLLLRTFVFAMATLLVVILIDIATFDRQAAHADYDRLKHGMAQHYANLDWQVEYRKVNLVKRDQAMNERLAVSLSRVQTYFAFRDFVSSFRDLHFFMASGDAPDNIKVGELSSTDAARSQCGEAGYENEDLSSVLDFASLPAWRPIGGTNFPAGISGELGVIRIAEFGENKYAAACAAVAVPDQSARELQLATRTILQLELRETLGELRAQGATRLAVDLTGNGGGSEWATEAAALFVSGDLQRPLPLLADATCDRMPIWRGIDTCAIYEATDELQTISGEGVWDGPLYLLVDNRSASATESFAVWLSASRKATLVGQTTAGAGCGFINGGAAVQLKSIPFHIMMPNCSRFGLDGINEIEGLTPDIIIDWQSEGAIMELLAI